MTTVTRAQCGGAARSAIGAEGKCNSYKSHFVRCFCRLHCAGVANKVTLKKVRPVTMRHNWFGLERTYSEFMKNHLRCGGNNVKTARCVLVSFRRKSFIHHVQWKLDGTFTADCHGSIDKGGSKHVGCISMTNSRIAKEKLRESSQRSIVFTVPRSTLSMFYIRDSSTLAD